MSVVAHLLRIAGSDLYRRSPFRIMGLETHVDNDLVDRRRLGMLAALGPEGDVVGEDLRLPLPRVTRQLLDRAVDALKSPEERLVEELFWWWGHTAQCGCPFEVHMSHNDAVHAHATALDLEGQRRLRGERHDAAWRAAARNWGVALAHEGFWHHVRHRAGEAVDFVDLRTALPRALLQPQVELAAQRGDTKLMALLDEWDVGEDIRTEAILRAAKPRLDELRAVLEHIGPKQLPRVPAVGKLVDVLERLERDLPDKRFQWSAEIRHPVEELLASCGITVAPTADTGDLCLALKDAVRWLKIEEVKRALPTQAAQQASALPWSYRPDGAERLDRVRRMLATGSFRSATRELEDWRVNATTSWERDEIRRLLDEIERRRAQTEVQAGAGAGRRRGWAGSWKAAAAILVVLTLVLVVALLLP